LSFKKNMSDFPSNYRRDTGFIAQASPDDEIDLRELISAVWKGKWIIVLVTAVFAVASVAYSLTLPNVYRSEALLAPVNQEQGGGMGGLAGQFGGLASLAGINLGSGSIDRTTLALEVMKSREFITKFVQSHDLLVPLMAADGWDQGRNELTIDPKLYDIDAAEWVREPQGIYGKVPTNLEAVEAFSERLDVQQEKSTGLVKVEIEHYSPEVAKQWVDWIVEAINSEMKARDKSEAERSVAYLERQLAQTRVAEMQNVLYQLIEDQAKTIMFAEVRDEYVFKTIDPAVVAEKKASPSRALICILGSFLGGVIAVVFVIALHFMRKNKNENENEN